MILTDKVKIKIVSFNIDRYKKLGYDVEINSEISIDIRINQDY